MTDDVDDLVTGAWPGPPNRRHKAPLGACAACDRYRREGRTFHPPHDPSPNCESGGRHHCTCDTCF